MASAERYFTMVYHEKPNEVPWNPMPVRVLRPTWAASALAQSRLHSEPNLRFVLTSDFCGMAWLGPNFVVVAFAASDGRSHPNRSAMCCWPLIQDAAPGLLQQKQESESRPLAMSSHQLQHAGDPELVS